MADPIVPAGGNKAADRLMPSLAVSARGMSVQQSFLEIIARNIANAETTRLPDGGPYRRQVASVSGDPATGTPAVRVAEDPTPGRMVYDPGHPDADSEGFVEYPNVDTQTELVDLMLVRRMYEANATVFQAAKRMLRRALEI
jgi:flagellar basal-body rod protein FlgC